MGWDPSQKLWMTTRGGEVLFGTKLGVTEDFSLSKLQSRGFGILDLGFRSVEEGYASGGSGSLYKTIDAGRTWRRDRTLDSLAGNLYSVKFLNRDNGYIL